MGRASISIAITSNFNSRGIDAAIRKAEQLATSAVHYQGQFGKAAVDMGASMGQASARLVSMGKSVAEVGDKLTMGVTVPMGLASAAAVMAATKIDTAWYNVRKTVDMTEEGYQRLKRSAMELSETQPVDAETILNIEALGGQLGITNPYLEDFARIVSGLDIATNMDADTAATELAQFRNIVQMSEDDLDNWAATVVDLGNNTATTEADMVNLAMRFASAGHIAGMSNADILGLSAALSGLGMNAEAGGSAISRTVNAINNAVATGGEDLAMWADLVGKAPEQFAEAWRAAPMDEFIDVLTHIGDAGADMGKVLDDLGITQLRQSDAMRRLASSGEYVSDVVERANRAWQENSALTQEVERRNQSLQARWDTYVNKFTNDLARIGQPLAEIGLDALDALEPTIQGVGDLAQAFADASPDVQRFAFNLAALAMAAGPVLSVSGRLMQAFGNVGQAVGRGYQAWGRYQEGLHSTDMSMITTLSNSQDLASQMGVSRNAIVKAAGGVETFNVAYRKTTNAIRDAIEQEVRDTAYKKAYREALDKGAESELKATEYAQKYAKSREVTAKVTEKQKAAIKELNDSIDESNVATKLNVKNVTEQEKAAEKASLSFGKMGDAIKGALLGLGAMALTGAAIAGVTWLVTQFQMAAERAENLRLATEGLRSSLNKTTDSAEEQNRVWGSSISAVDEAIEKQAQLGKTFEQNNTQAQVSMHTLDRAAEAIRQYANQSGLSASEQYKLKSAIETVNEVCGTQYSVVDASNGKIADETGTIIDNTGAILDNIEARKKQIQAQAIEANYQAAYEQELTTKKALRDVQNEFNDAMQRYNSYLDSNGKLRTDLSKSEREDLRNILDNLGGIRERLREANEAAGEATEATRFWESELDRVLESTSTIAENLRSDTDFSVAFEGIDDATRNIDAFAASTYDLGINMSALEGLSSTSANAIASAFDGTATSVVKAMEGIDEAKYILENIGNDWYNSFSTATQGIIGSVAALKGMTLAELRALAVDMGVEGEQATSAFMEGLDRGWSPERAAEIARQFDDAFDDSLDPEVAAQAAEAFVQALADGMNVQEALAKAQEIIDGINRTLSGANFSEGGTNAGHTFFAALNESIQQSALDSNIVYSDTGQAIGRVLADGTVVGLDEGMPGIYNEGTQVPEQYGQGASDNSGAAAGAGDSVVAMLMTALFGGVGQAAGVGSDTGQGYGAAIEAEGARAEQAALNTLGLLLVIWLLGIESAKEAGNKTGTGFATTLAESSQKAVTAAQAISIATGSAFGAGRSNAAAAGNSLGAAFASAVWSSGSQAISYARSIRSQVASIFANIPTANIKVNVTRTTSNPTRSIANALPLATPVMPVPSDAVDRAAAVAERAVYGIASPRSYSQVTHGSSLGSAITATVMAQQSQAIDYDTLFRVVKSGVASAIRESGGLMPVIELDGQKVSRQLVRSMDYELGRLDRMRG